MMLLNIRAGDNVMIDRIYDIQIVQKITPGKVVVVYGPRQVGKTTLISKFLESYNSSYYLGTGEDILLREILESSDVKRIINAFKEYDLIVIDEAQHIHNIGSALKILVDQLPNIKVLVSGSSSFDLSNKLGEPLTGRQRIMNLFPIAYSELTSSYGGMDTLARLEELIIYGSYPEVITSDTISEKKEYLITLTNSYLFRDILELENIKNSSKLIDLLRLIAFQIGHEVSLSELSNNLGIAKQTVERYLDLLEKSFVIKKISGFSRNLRKEIAKSSRYYFWDNGIRNAVINNFNSINLRDDAGMLWENFLAMERLKKQTYQPLYSNNFFWRTYDRQEIDWVEERDGTLFGFEFKWGRKKPKAPKAWVTTYPNATFEIINKENFTDFVSCV